VEINPSFKDKTNPSNSSGKFLSKGVSHPCKYGRALIKSYPKMEFDG
jgi:hypothetical protein